MINPNKHITLPQAKKLAELGFKADWEIAWMHRRHVNGISRSSDDESYVLVDKNMEDCDYERYPDGYPSTYPAYDADDLLVALNVYWSMAPLANGDIAVSTPIKANKVKVFTSPHPAWALGDLAVYLKKEELNMTKNTPTTIDEIGEDLWGTYSKFNEYADGKFMKKVDFMKTMNCLAGRLRRKTELKEPTVLKRDPLWEVLDGAESTREASFNGYNAARRNIAKIWKDMGISKL